MAAHRIIFVSQEISPYLTASDNGKVGRDLPQAMQARKYEVRTFMPDYGDINERRNQLHEVIRLSGMSIVIGESDHPLVVKVASMHPSRIQVYFIDNDDYFQKLDSDSDVFGSDRADNDERIIFYARGTVDTAKKLRWEPDLIHVSGWVSALVPLYVKRLYGPSFQHSKVVYCVQPEDDIAPVDPAIFAKLGEEGVEAADVEKFAGMPVDKLLLHHIGVEYSDGVVFRGVEPDPALTARCEARGIPYIVVSADADPAEELHNFYQSLIESK